MSHTNTSAAWLAAVIVSAYIAPARAAFPPGTATASSGQDHYAPELAVDGDASTRWGSHFTDDEWWQFEFDEPVTVAGLRIAWEAAYGEKYRVQTSMDGQAWTTVFEEDEGDGRTDYALFAPVETQHLRLEGIQRGTGWGYSIWELALFTGQESFHLTATSSVADHEPALAMDGKPGTAWKSEAGGAEDLVLHLPETMELGGLELHWGDGYASSYQVQVQAGEEDWKTVVEETGGNGDRDYVYFASTPVRRLRLRCLESHSGGPYELAEVKLKGGDEEATPIRQYLASARDARRGIYPRWLVREQEFWTTVGRVNEDPESLLGETGTFEPNKGDFALMPFVEVNGNMVTWADVELQQELANHYLPIPTARWLKDDWSLAVEAVASDRQQATVVRYRLSNAGSKPLRARLVLAARPIQLNPLWQYGGMSPINEIQADLEDPTPFVEINGKTKLFAVSAPTRLAIAPFENGDILDNLDAEADEATHALGMLSFALVYDLAIPAGGQQDVIVSFPLDGEHRVDAGLAEDPQGEFERLVAEEKDHWQEVLSVFEIHIPEQRIIDVMRSNIAYILLNQDGPWIKPGPRNYNHSWMRDGSMTSVALLRSGLNRPVKRFINAYLPLVADSGWVPWIVHEGGNPVGFITGSREGHEYDSQGQFPFLIRQYYDFTGDEEVLRHAYPSVVRALHFAHALREERMTEAYQSDPEKQPYYGLLPESNSHEGYYPAMHSYWDDFWYLGGLGDGAHLAEVLGQAEDAEWMRTEAVAFRKDLYASIRKVIERDGLAYIPGCVEKGDFDATSTAIAVMACGEKDTLPQPYARQTFDRYYEDFLKRLEPGGEVSFTPYEVRSADAFVRMGQPERALKMLRYFVADSTRPYGWNHFAEVVHGRPRTPSYIGDMPHTWVGSGYVSAVRTLFLYEEGEMLRLGAGIDPAWLDPGVSVTGMPSRFGFLDYTFKQDDGSVSFTASGTAAPPHGFQLSLPASLADAEVEVVDGSARIADGHLVFESLPLTVLLRPAG